jgi:hypothetical protein
MMDRKILSMTDKKQKGKIGYRQVNKRRKSRRDINPFYEPGSAWSQ